jgi:probable O-glycosylation ligase (exosortase A-associated)
MRSLLLLGLFFAAFPFAIVRPYMGIYLWTVFAYLNPHRLTWGAAFDFPFSAVIAGGTLLGLVFYKDRWAPPWSPLVVVWVAFIAWMCLTTVFALDSAAAFAEWDRTMKIQLFSFVTIVLINSREKLRTLVWVIALSIAFYGIKGGVFAIGTGGSYRIWGPEGTFIYDNNAIGLAFVMTIPLLYYLAMTVENRKLKYALFASIGLTAIATLSTHSRGALLGLVTIGALWLLNEKRKWLALVMLAVAVPSAVAFLPDSWFERMETIQTYEQDASAVGRILAWRFAGEIGTQRVVGGGFGAFVEANYRTYAPDVAAEIDAGDGRFQNAHSIYFSALGEHGIIGLLLFLGLGMLTVMKSRQIENAAAKRGDNDLALLAAMTRIAVFGYAICGAFQNRTYFDLYYHLIALIVILDKLVLREPVTEKAPARVPLPANGRHAPVTKPSLAD